MRGDGLRVTTNFSKLNIKRPILNTQRSVSGVHRSNNNNFK